jgi:hypothetical protein
VISHQTLDFSFSHNAKIAVSIRQRQTEAIRGTLQPAVIIALPTNADSPLQLNQFCVKPHDLKNKMQTYHAIVVNSHFERRLTLAPLDHIAAHLNYSFDSNKMMNKLRHISND